jgi:elongation factor Ts
MVKVTLTEIKALREKTGVGVQDCKEALQQSNGNFEKAIDFLRKKGTLKAQKRADKIAINGYIGSYIHNGRVGALIELMCETDFVARNEKFQKLANELALHIVSAAPLYIQKENVPKKVLEREKSIILDKLKGEKKPKNILDKIAEGQLNKFYGEVCLMEQAYVRDEKKTIKNLLEEALASFGEKIEIRRFVRMDLGENS